MRGYRASLVLGSLWISALAGPCHASGAERLEGLEAAPLAQPSAAETPVVIVMGGFSSCGQDPQTLAYSPYIRADYTFGIGDYHEPVQSALGALNAAPRFVFTCHTFGVSFPTTPGEQEPIQNQILFDTNLTALEPSLSQPHQLLPFKVLPPNRTTTTDDLLNQIVSAMGTLASPRIALVGHSYGAWNVIQLADRLLAAGYSIPYLLTLDPISMSDCTPGVFVSSLYNETPADACARAPEDLDAEIARVAAGVGSWTNYWQDQARWLHSSALESGAGKIRNVRLDYGHMKPESFGAHAFITYDPAVSLPERQRLVKALTD